MGRFEDGSGNGVTGLEGRPEFQAIKLGRLWHPIGLWDLVFGDDVDASLALPLMTGDDLSLSN